MNGPVSVGASALITAAILSSFGVATGTTGQLGESAYFPLHEGDRWAYMRADGSGERGEVAVRDSYWLRDQRAFRVDGYLFPFDGGDVHLINDGGRTLEPNPRVSLGKEGPTEPLMGIWYPWADESLHVELPPFGSDCIHGSGGSLASIRT